MLHVAVLNSVWCGFRHSSSRYRLFSRIKRPYLPKWGGFGLRIFFWGTFGFLVQLLFWRFAGIANLWIDKVAVGWRVLVCLWLDRWRWGLLFLCLAGWRIVGLWIGVVFVLLVVPGSVGRFLRLRCRFCRISWFFLSRALVVALLWRLSLHRLGCVACLWWQSGLEDVGCFFLFVFKLLLKINQIISIKLDFWVLLIYTFNVGWLVDVL